MRPVLPKDIKSDSVATIVCEPMSKLKSVPMDMDTTSVMLKFMMDPGSKLAAEGIIKQVWQATAMRERMKGQFGRDMDPRVAILLTMWAKSIGSCLLYMYYCHWMCEKKGIKGEFTIDHLVEFFPMGFFEEEDIHKVWDSQKVDNRRENFDGTELTGGGDNLIDYALASQSMGGVAAEKEEL